MVRFEYDPAFPEHVRPIVEPYLLRYASIVPSWCEYIRVEFNSTPGPDDADCVAFMKTFIEYRRACLVIFPQHLTSPHDYKERTIVHELLHLVNEPQRKCMRDFLFLLEEQEIISAQMKKYLTEQMRCANESQTEDMQNIVWKLLHANPV